MTIVATTAGHEAGIATQPGPGSMCGTVGYCSCGWMTRVAYTVPTQRDDARREAVAHVHEMAQDTAPE